MSKCTDNTTIQTTDSGEFTFTFERVDSSKFDELYNKEVYCAEGMKIDDDTPLLLANYFSKEPGCSEHINMYYCKGIDLHTYYHLTGNNAYVDDLTIVFIDWSRFEIGKFDVVGNKGLFRYFSDVVDNNARREIRKGNQHYNDYHSLYGDEWFYSTI